MGAEACAMLSSSLWMATRHAMRVGSHGTRTQRPRGGRGITPVLSAALQGDFGLLPVTRSVVGGEGCEQNADAARDLCRRCHWLVPACCTSHATVEARVTIIVSTGGRERWDSCMHVVHEVAACVTDRVLGLASLTRPPAQTHGHKRSIPGRTRGDAPDDPACTLHLHLTPAPAGGGKR